MLANKQESDDLFRKDYSVMQAALMNFGHLIGAIASGIRNSKYCEHNVCGGVFSDSQSFDVTHRTVQFSLFME